MQLLLLFILSLGVFLGFTWLLIFCRRRLHRSRHGLTGMCHDTGGTMCPSCRHPESDQTSCTSRLPLPMAEPPANQDVNAHHTPLTVKQSVTKAKRPSPSSQTTNKDKEKQRHR